MRERRDEHLPVRHDAPKLCRIPQFRTSSPEASEVGQNSGPCSGRAAATTRRMRHRLEATVRHPRQQHCARAAAVKLMPSMPRAETMRELLWRAREGAARERGRGASASARGGRREAAGAAMGTPHGGQRDLKDVILIGRRRESVTKLYVSVDLRPGHVPPLDNTDFTPPSPRDYSRSEPSSRAPSTVPMGEGDDSDGDATISESSDDGGGVDGVFDVFQDIGSDEDELN